MKIPFSADELRFELMGLKESNFDEAKMRALNDEFAPELPEDKRLLNQKIAESNGITVEQLIDSPNYKVLRDEYQEGVIRRFVKAAAEKLRISEKRAWAIVAAVKDLI